MRKGIHLSAPSFLLIKPLGSSAERKLTRKIWGLVLVLGCEQWGVEHLRSGRS